jgi:hypothetical protein
LEGDRYARDSQEVQLEVEVQLEAEVLQELEVDLLRIVVKVRLVGMVSGFG